MIERLVKEDFFELVGYSPHTPEVREFHASSARTRIAHAPARTSKSYAAAHEALFHCFPSYERVNGVPKFIREPTGERRIWLVGPDYKTIKEWDYLWWNLVVQYRKNPVLKQFYKITSKANSPHQGNMRIVMEFGDDREGNPVQVIVEGKSATNPESLQGEQVYLAVLSEAAEMDEKVLARYLGTRCKYVIAPTTPKLSAEWLKRLIDDGADYPELSIASFQFTPYANPHYDWELYWIEHAKAESRVTGQIITQPNRHDCFANLTDCKAGADPWFGEQFQGQWTGADERLLPFGAHHTINTLPENLLSNARFFVSCDYGYSDAAVALYWAVGERGSLVILGEVYERQITATDFVALVHDRSRVLGLRPDYYVGDPREPQVARLMRDRGLPVWDVDKRAMSDRAAGFTAIVDVMAVDPVLGHPRLRILAGDGKPWGCPNTIREFKTLRRKVGGTAKEWSTGAVVGDDHAVDACRYGIQTRPQPKGIRPDDEMARYLHSLRRRAAHRPTIPLPAGRLVGGAPAMNARTIN